MISLLFKLIIILIIVLIILFILLILLLCIHFYLRMKEKKEITNDILKTLQE